MTKATFESTYIRFCYV